MKKYFLLLFLAITLLSILARFWNYDKLVGFTLDGPIHLMGAKDMVESGKLALIGPSVTSKEVFGRVIFLGPFHTYVLALLGLLTNWNVVLISAFFTLLWIAAFIVLFFWLNKKFGGVISIVVYSLLSFYPFFIQVGRQIWNPQYIPLLGTLFLIFLVERKRIVHYFLAGVMFGLGLNVHYATLLWIFIALFFAADDIKNGKFHIQNWLMFLGGITVSELPLIIFEMRHNFYNLQTIIFQLRYGQLSQGYTFSIWYYYVLPFLPMAAYLFALFLKKMQKSQFFTSLAGLLSLLSLYLLISAFGPAGQTAMHYPGWSLAKQRAVSNMIIKDDERSFEVAETLSSDTRATDIRWWLRESGVSVMPVDAYKSAPVLYLIAPGDRPPETESVWEVSSMEPFKVVEKVELGTNLFFYKIERI